MIVPDMAKQRGRLMFAIYWSAISLVVVALDYVSARVQILEGMLPVCAVCKCISDERETWHPLEQYVLSQSKERIGHEVCPDCAAKFGEAMDRR